MNDPIPNDMTNIDLLEIIDLKNELEGRFAVRVPIDLLNVWKWVISSMKSEASIELRKLVLGFCQEKLDNSFTGKFNRESICPNCNINVVKPWLVPLHQAKDCKILIAQQEQN